MTAVQSANRVIIFLIHVFSYHSPLIFLKAFLGSKIHNIFSHRNISNAQQCGWNIEKPQKLLLNDWLNTLKHFVPNKCVYWNPIKHWKIIGKPTVGSYWPKFGQKEKKKKSIWNRNSSEINKSFPIIFAKGHPFHQIDMFLSFQKRVAFWFIARASWMRTLREKSNSYRGSLSLWCIFYPSIFA